MPSLRRAIYPLSEDDEPRYTRISGNPMESSTLEHWKYEEARHSGSAWLMRLSSDVSQKQVVLRFSEVASVVHQFEDIMSENMSLPTRHSHRPKDYSRLEKAPAVEASSSFLEAFFAQEHGPYRTHGGRQRHKTSNIIQRTSTSTKTGKRKQSESDRKISSDNDDEETPERNKIPRLKLRNLKELVLEFACLICKGDIGLGSEARCRDWSSKSMDTVVRRHLKKHVDLGQITEEVYRAANDLLVGVSLTNPAMAAELWKKVFMQLFGLAEHDRHRVPSPYWELPKELEDPLYRPFVLAIRQHHSIEPAYAEQSAQFLTQHEDLEQERNKMKARLEGTVEDRRSQLEAEYQQANAEIDMDIDRKLNSLRDRYDIPRNIAVDAVPAPFSGHTQPAGSILDSMLASPPGGLGQMNSQQSEQLSFADSSWQSLTPPIPPPALDPGLATGIPLDTQASIPPYEPAPLPAQDADSSTFSNEIDLDLSDFFQNEFGNQSDNTEEV